MTRKITHKQMSQEIKSKFWFDWDSQKRCVYDIALELYMEKNMDASNSIRVAHDFVETFRSEVMDMETKIYYNRG